MRSHILLVSLLLLAGSLKAQQAALTKLGSKPDSVPIVYGVESRFERVVVLRVKYGTDLLAGIEEGVKKNHISNAVIVSGIGSVTSYHYHVVGNTQFPTKNLFVKQSDSPADLTSMNGYVIQGRIHAHATFADTAKVFGGHLEPGTLVYTFAIVTLGVLSDSTDLSHVDDSNYR